MEKIRIKPLRLAYAENKQEQAPPHGTLESTLDNETVPVTSDAPHQDEQGQAVMITEMTTEETSGGEHTARRLLLSAPKNYLATVFFFQNFCIHI